VRPDEPGGGEAAEAEGLAGIFAAGVHRAREAMEIA